jgi:serine/threonine-protein kinase
MEDLFDRLQQHLPQRYLLERELKRGGMGTVYLAREQHPSRLVVIKVLHPHLTAHLGRERFLREIDLTSKLTHPHIVPIFAAGEANDLLYYAMPYLRGESLADRIAREHQLPLDDALRITRDVAHALDYAHQQNVLHRDVKPGNILLHEEHALVTDFGVSRAIRVAGSDSLTETGVALGTPAYMSPEQVQASDDLDGRADVYALACVLYEMLAGEPPFQGKDARTVLARHLVDPVPSLRAARDTVSVQVEQVVNVAMAKAPVDRFPTARDFSDALLTARGEQSSGWTTPLPVAGIPEGRSHLRRWTKDAVFAVVVVVLALFAWQPWKGRVSATVGPRYVDSVAVMPFDNLTGDQRYDYLSAGITEEIFTQISQIAQLKVISPHSVEALRSKGLTTPQLAESLRVRHVIQGSLRLAGNSIRASAHHVNAESDATIWSETFTGDLTDIFAAQESIARQVSAKVASTIGDFNLPDYESKTALGPGYEEYLVGRRWLSQRTADGIKRSINWFNEALAQNPRHAPSLADLSTAYALSLTYRYRLGADEYRLAALSLALADSAIALDPNLASAHAARGYIGALANAPTEDVAADFGRALELQPNAPTVPGWRARVLAKSGHLDSALAETQRAAALDPFSSGRHIAVAIWALQMRRYELAIAEAAAAGALEPALVLPQAVAARALLLSGDAARCLEFDLGPHAVIRAMCLRALGRAQEAKAIADSVAREVTADSLRDTLFSDVARVEDLASYHAMAGDVPFTISWVKRAYDLSPSGIDSWVLESALFDRVRDHPMFVSAVHVIRSRIWGRVRSESSGTIP